MPRCGQYLKTVRPLCLPIVLLMFSGLLSGQGIFPTQAGEEPGARNGFRFNEISFSTTYMDLNFPPQSGGNVPTKNVLAGVSANFGWVVTREKTNFVLSYSPSYISDLNHSSQSGANQSLTLSLRRKINEKWTLAASAAASLNTFNQFLFNPTGLSQFASTQATFDQFAAALLTGTSTNIQLNNILSAATVLDSPATPALYGNRFFGSSATTGLSYAPTARLTISWNASASRVQPIQSGTSSSYAAISNAATLGQAGMAVSYSLSPRTEVGVAVSASRNLSTSFPRVHTGVGSMNLSRTVSRRWFVRAGLGGGYTRNMSQSGSVVGGPQYTYTGGIGFKSYANTIVASYSRSLNNTGLALGGGVFNVGSATWSYHRAGSNLSLQVSSSYQELKYPGLTTFTSWSEVAGFTWMFTPRLSFQASCATGEFGSPGSYFTLGRSQGPYSAAMISLAWSPQAKLF